MASINSNLVPTISPGNLFTRLTEDTSINIRWLTATDPVYFEVLNRPHADMALRQLIIAKSVDQLNASLGFMAMFPFLIQPIITDGTTSASVPIRIFWDMHVSVPDKWKNLRLARIDRIDGTNSPYTGTARFIFVANQEIGGSESAIETALFYADYEIDSSLTYQIVEVSVATVTTTPGFAVINAAEVATIGGTIIFATADSTETEVAAFYNLIAPGTPGTYDIADSIGGTSTDSFQIAAMDYGTGLLTSGAYNYMTDLGSDPSNWLEAFNYPFDLTVSTMSSTDGTKVIPAGLFDDFDICVPTSDQHTGDATGEFFPVWISKIEKISDSPATLVLYFSTYSIEQAGTAVEFATMTLQNNFVAGRIVRIQPENHLYTLQTSTGTEWYQEFGRGHAQLSTSWGTAGGGFNTFFTQFPSITGLDTVFDFGLANTRVSSFGLSRVPQYSPTAGQAAALVGTAARFTVPSHPDNSNRYVTELDEGEGNQVDLDLATGTSSSAIEQFGSMGTRSHKLAKLVIDTTHDEANFYVNEILPRLTILFGRAPIFGDSWYNGTRFLTFNGDSWVG